MRAELRRALTTRHSPVHNQARAKVAPACARPSRRPPAQKMHARKKVVEHTLLFLLGACGDEESPNSGDAVARRRGAPTIAALGRAGDRFQPRRFARLDPPQQSTPPFALACRTFWRTAPSPLREQTPPRSPLSCSSPPAPRCPRRAASRWRPVRARPLGWRGALWCGPHQPRSLVLIHLLSFSGLIVVASRLRCPDCNAGASRAGVAVGAGWAAWGARPLLVCPPPRLPNDRRDLPRLWCTRG